MTEENPIGSETWHGDLSKFARMKILIVDDERANGALLGHLLSAGGYSRLKIVTDSNAVLEACRSFEPDLILLDLMMPQPDGFAILESLRAQPAETFLPIIVLTADANEETRRRALRAGATDFLLKPFDQVEVLLRMANLLEIRHLNIQLETQRAAFEDALRARATELRQAQSQLQEAHP
jgi:putative two-component system response regulator